MSDVPRAAPADLGASTAPDLRGEIELSGARAFAISPAGELWLATRTGELYVSGDWNRTWSEVPLDSTRPDDSDPKDDELEHLRFFDRTHALVAGYVGDERRDQILRTEDGGRSWSVVRLPQDLWVYDAQAMPDAHAWLVGSTGALLASDDFGRTWRVAGRPFDGMHRSGAVCFASPEIGVVGATMNALKLTRDGGHTWTSVPTPIDAFRGRTRDRASEGASMYVELESGESEWRELPEGPNDAIERVWIVGGRLFVMQANALYRRDFEAAGRWERVEIDGHAVVAAERAPQGFVVLTEDARLHVVSEDFVRLGGARSAIDSTSALLAAGDRGVATIVDRSGGICVLDGDELACSRMKSDGAERTWPIASFDRAVDGTFYGTSSSALYRSTDGAKTWERLLELDDAEGVRASVDGSGAIVGTREGLQLWDQEKRSLQPLGGDAARSSIGWSVRHGRLWVACTFDHTPEVEAMLDRSHAILVGQGFTARIFASADDGRSWRAVDTHAGTTVHALWLGADGVASVCMSDGSMRQGRLDASNVSSWPTSFVERASASNRLGGQWASWLAFADERNGWVGGNRYYGGAEAHHSSDGGRTWTAIERPSEGVTAAFLLRGGTCARVVGFWDDTTTVEFWKDGRFVPVHRFEPGARDAHVDAGGRLLVRLMNAEVWECDPDNARWSKIALITLPPK